MNKFWRDEAVEIIADVLRPTYHRAEYLLEPSEYVSEDYQDSACVAQQMYAELMGWA